jgi:hypothetical protein
MKQPETILAGPAARAAAGPGQRPFKSALLAGLCAIGLTGQAQAGPCTPWGLAVCRLSSSDVETQGRILWSDETVSSARFTTTKGRTVVNGTSEFGDVIGLYNTPQVHGAIGWASFDPGSPGGPGSGFEPYYGLGPALVYTYRIEKSAAQPAAVNNHTVYLGQANAPFFGSGQGGTPNLRFDTYTTSDFGINHAAMYVSGEAASPQDLNSSNLIKPGLTGRVLPYTLANARSTWSDNLSFYAQTGGGTVNFDVELEGSLTAEAAVVYTLSLSNSGPGLGAPIIQATFSGSDGFQGGLSKHLTGTLDVPAGFSTFNLTGNLIAQVAMPDAYTSTVSGTVAYAADFSHTARLSAISLSSGLEVSYDSGSAYLAGITHAGTVPEPPAALLMAAGLGLALLQRRAAQRGPVPQSPLAEARAGRPARTPGPTGH